MIKNRGLCGNICIALLAAAAAACDGGASPKPGALVRVTSASRVGVVLDELPAGERDRVAGLLMGKDAAFWIDRIHAQLKLTTYRLVFREQFYDDPKQQLPLPPESNWDIKLSGTPKRETIDGHDAVVVDYLFSGTLLTDSASPGISEPALAKTGGKWEEDFVLPVDPQFIFQRTRFACLDEAEFPPHSVDSEEIDSFYDDSCDVEPELSNTGCHQTELPATSCVAAVQNSIGHVDLALEYERLPWSAPLADRVRSGPVTNPTGADLQPETSEFREHRITYRYIEPDSCTLVEQCVAAPGWRRLLQFSTADRNVGAKTLNIGAVDYFIDGVENPNQAHHVFEYSACHNHYHFRHYGSFTFNNDAATTSKRGFCLQSTNRFSNNESSPLHNPYGDCGYQGIESGWVDEYKAGLECQWVDVTGVDTSRGPVTGPLQFVSNPDGFLCEGTPKLDEFGAQLFEPTAFLTEDGLPVDRPACDQYGANANPPLWSANDKDAYDVTLPADGNGYVTDACPHGEIGPLRNCGFSQELPQANCTAGNPVALHCSVDTGSAPQVLRVCDHSAALRTGVPCTFQAALANVNVASSPVAVGFSCPAAHADTANEPGGAYSLYSAPVWPQDAAATVHCTTDP